MKFNGLIPELSVSDINVSKSFYLDVLGFHLEYERTADKFAFLSLNDAQIMIEEVNDHWETGELTHPFGRGINLQITTDHVEKIKKRLENHQSPLYKDVFESRYQCGHETICEKEILVQDPDGYLLRFSQTLGELK